MPVRSSLYLSSPDPVNQEAEHHTGSEKLAENQLRPALKSALVARSDNISVFRLTNMPADITVPMTL